MDLKNYAERSKFIKKIIFWTVIIGGIIAIFFIQSATANGFKFISQNFLTPIEIKAQGEPIDVCDPAFGIGCLPGTNEQNLGRGSNAVVRTVIDIVLYLIYIAGAVAIFFIVLGGYTMMSANGDKEKYTSGLKSLQYAVMGLVLVILSVTIILITSAIIPNVNIFG